MHDVSGHPRCLALGDKGRGQWPGAQLKCHLLRDTSPCASVVTAPPCLLLLPPRSFTAPGLAVSAPAGARHPSVLCPGTPFLPTLPPPQLPPSRCAMSRPSLHGADSSTSCSVYSLSRSTVSALWEQQNPFFLKCDGFLSYSPLECQRL